MNRMVAVKLQAILETCILLFNLHSRWPDEKILVLPLFRWGNGLREVVGLAELLATGE